MPPAARATDMHTCPQVTGIIPHVGGPIIPPCEPTVLIGMLPAALATGIGCDVQRGLATVVSGGLIPATLLTLFIIPTFYFVVERRIEHGVLADTDTATATL